MAAADNTPETDAVAVTLKYPHRSAPSVSESLGCYDIHVGPKRTIHRHRESVVLLVPPYQTWTLDTVRVVLHELGDIVDGRLEHRRAGDEPPQQASVLVGSAGHHYTSVRFVVDGPKSGATLCVSLQDFTEPMQAALRALPPGPFLLDRLKNPPYARAGESESTEQTEHDWRRFHRVVRNLKRITEEQPSMLDALDSVIQLVLNRLGLDDDDA